MTKPARSQSAVAGEVLGDLAATVRALRRRNGWSLVDLAQRSGLSRGMLLQIESARTNPSIGTLIHIANAFGMSVWELFGKEEGEARVAPPGAAVTLWRSRAGGTATLLIGAQSPQPVELWEWRLAPGDGYDAEEHLQSTFEVLHVRKGRLTLVVGDRRLVLGPGSAAVVRTDQAHAYRNEGRTWVEMAMTVVEPRR